MADRRRGFVFDPGQTEFTTFREWVKNKYGALVSARFNETNYKDTEYYRFWIQTGKPTGAIEIGGELTPTALRALGREVPGEEVSLTERLFEEAGGRPQPAPAPKPEPVTFKVRVPGEVIEVSDGTFTDYQGTPLDPAVAERMITEYDASGQPAPEGLTEWQQAQLEATRRTELGATWRAQQGMLAKRWEFGTQRLAQWGQFGARDNTANARRWENTQAEILSQYDPDRDWLNIWKQQQKVNPWVPEVRTAHEEVRAAEAEQQAADEARKIAFDELDALNIKPERAGALVAQASTEAGYAEMTPLNRGLVDEAHKAVDLQRRISGFTQRVISARKSKVHFLTGGDYKAEEREIETGVSSDPVQPPRPTGPETPSWLSKLYPRIGKTVQPLKQMGAISGQAWQGLTGPQQQQALGFAEFSGIEPETIVPKWQQRRPGPRWAPQKQRISV